MFSNILSFLSSGNVNDQVSHPYKTTGKIIVLYILIFKFSDGNLEDKTFYAMLYRHELKDKFIKVAFCWFILHTYTAVRGVKNIELY